MMLSKIFTLKQAMKLHEIATAMHSNKERRAQIKKQTEKLQNFTKNVISIANKRCLHIYISVWDNRKEKVRKNQVTYLFSF